MMMTQTEITNKAGIGQQFVSKILAGLRRPSWKTAKKLAEATGTNPVLWLEGTPEEIKQALSGYPEGKDRRSGKNRRSGENRRSGHDRRKGPGRRKENGLCECHQCS